MILVNLRRQKPTAEWSQAAQQLKREAKTKVRSQQPEVETSSPAVREKLKSEAEARSPEARDWRQKARRRV